MTDGITASRKGMGMRTKVFLGGTCNDSTWRDELIPKLKIDHFNPVVPDWTPECQVEELKQREKCDFVLYVITPRMQGVYSIAEVIDDCWSKSGCVLFCFLEKDKKDEKNILAKKGTALFETSSNLYFTTAQKKSLIAVGNMVERRGGMWFKTMDDVVAFLNKY